MKKILLSLSILLAASSAQATSTNSQYFTVDDSVDSQLCLIAATDGYQAALSKGKEIGGKYTHFTKDTVCNGQSIKSFAKAHQNKATDQADNAVAVYAANQSNESKLCLKALKVGIKSVAQSHYVKNVKCNGEPIDSFVKRYGKI